MCCLPSVTKIEGLVFAVAAVPAPGPRRVHQDHAGITLFFLGQSIGHAGPLGLLQMVRFVPAV